MSDCSASGFRPGAHRVGVKFTDAQRKRISAGVRAALARGQGSFQQGKFFQLSLDDRAKLISLYRSGWGCERLAPVFGVTGPTIIKWLRMMRVEIRPPRITCVASGPILTPAWVPEALQSEFQRRALRFGEESAASWARKAKRRMV